MACILIFDVDAGRITDLLKYLDDFEVLITSDRTNAIRLVVERKPDLVLADWFQSDGHGLFRELQGMRDVHIPPFILMEDLRRTENAERLRDRAKTYGAAGLLLRPVDLGVLCAAAQATVEPYWAENAWSERITLYGSQKDELMTEEQLDQLNTSPLTQIAELVGGIGVITMVVDRLKIHTSRKNLERLWSAIKRWGSLTPTSQLICAVEMTYALKRIDTDPVESALYVLAINATTLGEKL